MSETVKKIDEGCDIDYDIYFAINGKLNSFFTKVRTTFLENSKIKAFMVDRPVNEHKLITLGMEMTGEYDATIIYSAKEEPNVDVIKAFISSWKAGNKIVYLRKEYSGFKKLWVKDNKPHGFDVQDLRLGGLKMRLNSCMERLSDLLDGKIDKIDELEEELLCYHGKGKDIDRSPARINHWVLTASPNVL